MKIEKFLQLTDFNEFKTIGKKLIEIDDLPKWFWDKATIPLNYNMLPDYCKLVNEYRMRYIEIEFEDDVVGFVFKVVQIIKTKQIRLFEVPFSLNNNNNNIKIVITHLYNMLQNNCIILSSLYKIGILDIDNCNFYYNYNYYINRVTNKYRRQHRFSRYENNFTLQILTTLDKDNEVIFMNIYNKWHELKNNAASPKSFLHALKQKNKQNKYLYYIGTLNNISCICGIGIITKYGLYIIFEYSLDRTNILYDNIVIYTSKILSEQLYKQFNLYNIYKLGARKNDKGLINFKKRTSEDKINIYKLNITQLLEQLDK